MLKRNKFLQYKYNYKKYCKHYYDDAHLLKIYKTYNKIKL